ncbi:hypothetical protein GN244_ATG09398 [Phytophthora infestans]|uniref:Uncharacterized protein n=1 Tax=Phytophthora infestans TaxID=4787 RepID=A0A833SB69_PHYIN|nr:hypothetical protein GN244_ATG09398 [Phytophthora infestans]KAF4138258.1 hypothetical protein GN958_ATG12555 [Phytophthora infestans]KAF4145890.1 hypothetical protein GN958_ATG04930 [Phytophthora infestans]
MLWNVALTSLAIETRFKNPRVVTKFTDTTSGTKHMRTKCEAAAHTFLEALMEGARDEGQTP